MTIDRQLRYSQNNPIHQTKVMMDLVTKNGLDLNKDAEVKNIFDLNKINLILENYVYFTYLPNGLINIFQKIIL